MSEQDKKIIIYKLNCNKVDINDIDYQLNNYKLNNNKLLIPKQTPKIIKAKAYLKKYNKYNLLNKFNYGGE